MKIAMIGGTGIISSAVSDLLLARGHELYLVNRGTSVRPLPPGARSLRADIRDPEAARKAVGDHRFDVVVDWLSFVPSQVETALEIFGDRTDQYVFISSASAYRKPHAALPIVEANLLHNPFWEYSRNKIACEELLVRLFRTRGTPVTIVRPSHTYDKTLLPMDGGWTVVDRMLRGREVIVPGDGTSLWTLTHHSDFAKGFVGLLGHPLALGEVFHITGDEWLTWNEIFRAVAAAAGTEARVLHVPSDLIAREDPSWGAGLLGDKAHCTIFDNSKVKRLVPDFVCTVPFVRGIREVIDWYRADPVRQAVNPVFDGICDRLAARMHRAWE